MSRVDSNYERKERDEYITPSWVTEAVIPFLPAHANTIWEPACGDGAMVRVFADNGYDVYATDVTDGEDFLQMHRERSDAAISKHSQQGRIIGSLGITQKRDRAPLSVGQGLPKRDGKTLRSDAVRIRSGIAAIEDHGKTKMAHWKGTRTLHRRHAGAALSQDDRKETLQSLWRDRSVGDPSQGRESYKQCAEKPGGSLLALSHQSPQARVLGTPAGDWGIAANPPFGLATQFIENALQLTAQHGFVAMLLPIDFDSAKSRRHLFADCPVFAKKIVLTKRIVWFERTDGKRPAPSENHCWMLWDWQHGGPPTIHYAP